MRVGMIGLGKLGKPVAVAIAAKGHSVMGYDVIPELMSKDFTAIEAGPNKEPNGFKGMLQKSDLQFGSMQEVVDHSEIVFLAIQTPHGKEYEGITRVPNTAANFDYSYLVDCIEKLNACKIDRPIVVSIISTVLPFTIRRHVLPKITNPNIKVVYNPFFIAMGTVVWDFYNPEFVLIGRYDGWACKKLKELYATIHSKPFAEMSIESAELTKVSYNTFITMKIDYVNYLMEICDQIPNANVDDVTNALKMATDRLISPKYLTPGGADGGGCILPDELVYTENGPKKIKDIQVGERVLSENGELKAVTEVFKLPYSGKVVKLKAKGLPAVTLTPDHKICVSKDLRTKYNTISRGKPVVKYNNKTVKSLPEQTSEIQEIEVGKLTKDYYLLFPTPKQYYTEVLNPNYVELAGYYVSEGNLDGKSSGGPNRTTIAMHSKECEDLARIDNLAQNLGENPKRITKPNKPNSEDVRINSTFLARSFLVDFGKLAATKTLPPWLVYGPIEQCKLFLKSLWRGDGSSHSHGFSYSTISTNLAYNVMLLLYRFGIPSALHPHPARVGKDGQAHRPSFDIAVANAAYIKQIAEITGKQIKHKMQDKKYTNVVFEKSGYFYRHVWSIEEQEYTGDVYNLTVEDSHKYVTNVGLTLNCHCRDNIAMSWLAKELNMKYDFCKFMMTTREAQTEYLADKLNEIQKEYKLPLELWGKAFKANIGLTTGSFSVLLSNLLKEKSVVHTFYDPLVDQTEVQLNEPKIYCLSTQHDIFKTLLIQLPKGSVVIDPFRYYKDSVPTTCTYIPIGIGSKE